MEERKETEDEVAVCYAMDPAGGLLRHGPGFAEGSGSDTPKACKTSIVTRAHQVSFVWGGGEGKVCFSS